MTDELPHTGHTTQPQRPSYPPLQQPQVPEHDDRDDHEGSTGHDGHGGHGGHGLLMIACCIPMLVIVGILVATGVAGSGAILYAVVCTAMMALMMFAMPGGDRH